MTTKSKSSSTKKTSSKKTSSAKPKAAQPKTHTKTKHTTHTAEQRVASTALKFIDQAADLLRKGVIAGRNTTETARTTARKQAHSLLNKAQSHLTDLIDDSSDALHKIVKKF